ncbi:MAG: rlmn3 [Chlamydiales bacterium]|jgi:23S rRNA (adenine2503-C2)-methyltransferase|nr:rlmn3 [Chlamydiales bacterium]
MTDLCGLTLDQLKNWLKDNGEPSFRAQQITQWIYEKNIANWDEMTNLSKALRQKLSEQLVYPLLHQKNTQESKDGETIKFLWQLNDGYSVESVLICSDGRRTVCVSSQVGCGARCAFCASGKQGWKRNLSTAEIIEQVVHINRYLQQKGERVSHIVFMGMGEPLENYDNVVAAVKQLISPDILGISQRRVTISTVGIVDNIRNLAQEGFKINLVLSLHAPSQHIRKKIIPYARRYELVDILAAMDEYATLTKRDITYEYTLLEGINDQPEHAEELAQLLRGKQCTVNLIPYNPVPGVNLNRPDNKVIHQFQDILTKHRIVTTCRYTKGVDIAAACGQLALQDNPNITLASTEQQAQESNSECCV